MKPQELLNEASKDTGWHYGPTAKPNKGFHDYERIIQFPRKLVLEEVFLLTSYFDLDKESKTPYHYGGLIGNFTHSDVEDGQEVYVYKFECSCDSSD